jgi:hypothetical protein
VDTRNVFEQDYIHLLHGVSTPHHNPSLHKLTCPLESVSEKSRYIAAVSIAQLTGRMM